MPMTLKKPKQTVEECALGLLARREHSVAELRRKLRDKGYAAAEVADCVEKLETRGHVFILSSNSLKRQIAHKNPKVKGRFP